MSEPRYLQRDATGAVIGHYANPQPYATEQVPEDHPDILAWQAKRMAAKAAYMERKIRMSPEALMARIEALENEVRRGR